MAYVTRATTWPNGTILFDESTKNLVARVYELLDSKDPSSGARLAAEVFSEDGLFAGGTGRFEGFHEISHCRERVWETVTDREHTVARVYALDDSCSDLMINGVAKTTFAAGTLDVTPFVARLLLTGYGEELRIKHMQVFIPPMRKT